MKNLLLALLVLFASAVDAQTVQQISALSAETVRHVDKTPSPETTWIASPFANGSLEARDKAWNNLAVSKVELIYTRYRLSPTFNQQALNRQRLINLKRAMPDWFNNPAIEWAVVEQTGATNPVEGTSYFHGFRVTHRALATDETIEEELALLQAMANTLNQQPDPVPVANDSLPQAKSFSVSSRWDDVRGYLHDTTWYSKPTASWADVASEDSLITSVLMRHNWDSMLVVIDVTNSMAPYTAQVLSWVKLDLAAGRTLHYTFFTDGDGKPDGKKVAGNTGGIHHSREKLVDPMLASIGRAMKKCKNNDLPENDLEAVLAGLEKCPECKEIVLIADNFSKMRDYSFRTQIGRPMHIIPCGITSAVNMQYLTLARNTQGSIHTVNQDVPNLWKLQEGEELVISGVTYGIVSGKLTVLDW